MPDKPGAIGERYYSHQQRIPHSILGKQDTHRKHLIYKTVISMLFQ